MEKPRLRPTSTLPLFGKPPDHCHADTQIEEEEELYTLNRENGVLTMGSTTGINGAGAVEDPYDASTAAKFDALMDGFHASHANMPLVIHLYPGTYLTNVDGNNDYAIRIRDSWQIRGCGREQTTIKLSNPASVNPTYPPFAVISSRSLAADLSNMVVSDLTIDCDGASATHTIGAVELRGKNFNRIERVRVKNAFNEAGDENFILWIWANPGSDGYKALIRDCVVENALGAYHDAFCISGSATAFMCGGLIENCFFNGNNQTTVIGLGAWQVKGLTLRSNVVLSAAYGVNIDSLENYDVVIEDNDLQAFRPVRAGGAGTYQGWRIARNILRPGWTGSFSDCHGIYLQGNCTKFTVMENVFRAGPEPQEGSTNKFCGGTGGTGNADVNWYDNHDIDSLGAWIGAARRGLPIERMSAGQRNILSPSNPCLIYNTTNNKLNFFNGSAWEVVTSG